MIVDEVAKWAFVALLIVMVVGVGAAVAMLVRSVVRDW